jgi:small-conductance mechanosensitive channel
MRGSGGNKMQGSQNWGEVALASIAAALALVFSAIPKILGFALILVIGWILAAVVARVVAALLRRLRFEDLSARSGFGGFIKNMGVTTDASGFIALLVKWFIRLMALVVAFDALGLPAISDVLRHLLLWIPNLAVGLLVLVTGGLLANALASLVRGTSSQAGLDNPLLLSQIARVAVWAFALIVALNQIGVAATLVNSLFMAIVGAAALAFGLAFGLGGRDTAAQIIRSWYERGRTDGTRIEQAAKSAAVRAGDKRRVSPEPRTLPRNSVVLLYRLREFSINS